MCLPKDITTRIDPTAVGYPKDLYKDVSVDKVK
jgi:hypothetical protein